RDRGKDHHRRDHTNPRSPPTIVHAILLSLGITDPAPNLTDALPRNTRARRDLDAKRGKLDHDNRVDKVACLDIERRRDARARRPIDKRMRRDSRGSAPNVLTPRKEREYV